MTVNRQTLNLILNSTVSSGGPAFNIALIWLFLIVLGVFLVVRLNLYGELVVLHLLSHL